MCMTTPLRFPPRSRPMMSEPFPDMNQWQWPLQQQIGNCHGLHALHALRNAQTSPTAQLYVLFEEDHSVVGRNRLEQAHQRLISLLASDPATGTESMIAIIYPGTLQAICEAISTTIPTVAFQYHTDEVGSCLTWSSSLPEGR